MTLVHPDEDEQDRRARELMRELNVDIMGEDVDITTRVQRGVQAPSYHSGILNDEQECSVIRFQQRLRELLPRIAELEGGAARGGRIPTWLFLPPEVEALVPTLLAGWQPPGAHQDEVERELRHRIETLILEGDAERWRSFLRARRPRWWPSTPGDDADARRVLASILDDQFLLARAVVDLERADEDASRRLARLG